MGSWIEWKENDELKNIVAEGFVEWAAILEDLYQKRLEHVNGSGFEKG
ncbi:hypothetical protein P8868_07290 [Bacillus inaquosorum]|nr:hypothetical protein [Bacillus inaquosorum]PPA38092.1 hypothetical protein C4E21_01455 [Bacillus subtilis]AMA54699.1 hypothetical protein AN935_09075 [Bacillus inaquosorum]MBT2191338.1 hypothetical protein [Bacillus inaquosorum]MBT3118679.1 hypothetical protein [Bacillus inaquosorum]MBT3121244.1 hypothetical protein [Bacillus inaquosorum]